MSKAPGFDGTQECAKHDGDLFFPDNAQEMKERLPLLRSICAQCRFTNECLMYALDNPMDGFWGGKTPGERKKIRRRRKASVSV